MIVTPIDMKLWDKIEQELREFNDGTEAKKQDERLRNDVEQARS